jgi:mono/diheme cytochrome c family protein
MKTWIRRTALGAVLLVAAAGLAFVVAAKLGERKMERRIEVAVAPVAYEEGAAVVERGRYLYTSRGCADCHGADGGGRVVVDNGKGLFVRAPNIAGGASAVASYAPVDWVRTIRHGVKPDGRPLLIMPSEDWNRLTDADLAALVAYTRQLPPAPGGAADIRMPMPLKALYAVGLIPDAAEKIDHSLPPAQPVPEGVNPAHGAYVANACIGCHGAKLTGGKIPGAPPDWPAASRLRPGEGSAMARYPTADSFAAMLKTGKRPDGSKVSPVMPFAALGAMSDVDVRALYLHLRALPEGS